MSITVREAGLPDYEAINSLYQSKLRTLAENHPDQYRLEGAEIGLKKQTFINVLENEDWTFLVAEFEGKTLGAVQLSVDEDQDSEYRFAGQYVWIEELLVEQGQDLKAVATALIAATHEWAKELNISTIDFIIYNFADELQAICGDLGFKTFSTRVRHSLS